MPHHAKAFKMTVGVLATVAMALLTFSIVQFAAPSAEATPALAKGKACKTCHTSSKPSRSDVKGKRSDIIWPDGNELVLAHLSLR